MRRFQSSPASASPSSCHPTINSHDDDDDDDDDDGDGDEPGKTVWVQEPASTLCGIGSGSLWRIWFGVLRSGAGT